MQAGRVRQLTRGLVLLLAMILLAGCGPVRTSTHAVRRTDPPPLSEQASTALPPSPLQLARRELRVQAGQVLGVVRMVDRRWGKDKLAAGRGRGTRARLYSKVLANLQYADSKSATALAVVARTPRLSTLGPPWAVMRRAMSSLAAALAAGSAPASAVDQLTAAAAALIASGEALKLHLWASHVPQLTSHAVTLPPDPLVARARLARAAARKAVRLDTGVAWGVVRRYLEHAVSRGTFAADRPSATRGRARARLLRALAVGRAQLEMAHRSCATQPTLTPTCAAIATAMADQASVTAGVKAGADPTPADAIRLEAAFVGVARTAAAVRMHIVARRAPTVL